VVLTAGVALLEGSTWIPLSNFWVAGIVVIVYLVLINLKNFFLRPYIMGRSLHMNEALVFVIILIATILEGILGALLVVPFFASAVLIASYIQRRVMGLSPFEDDGSTQFVIPEDKIPVRTRKWGRRKTDKLDEEPASSAPQGATVSEVHPATKPTPARKKSQK
jgi:hypothetical protein